MGAACKDGPAPLSNFNHSGPAIELLLLGNVASLVDGPLEFDPVPCKITNHDEANRALRREHREGWALSARRSAALIHGPASSADAAGNGPCEPSGSPRKSILLRWQGDSRYYSGACVPCDPKHAMAHGKSCSTLQLVGCGRDAPEQRRAISHARNQGPSIW